MRALVRETELTPAHLVAPLFVEEGLDGRAPIASMPGQARLGMAALVEEARAGGLREARWFARAEEAAAFVASVARAGDHVLVKASRGQAFERLMPVLEGTA